MWAEAVRSGGGHLHEPALSLYINYYSGLSDAERTFAENHLAGCAACRARFDRVFDDEIDLDANRLDMILKPEAGSYADASQELMLKINRSDMVFISVPEEYRGQKMRIRISDKTLRILSVQPNTPIAAGVSFEKENILTVAISVVRPGSAEPSEELKPFFVKYIRYLAAAVLIVVAGGLVYESMNLHDQAQQAGDTRTTDPDTAQKQAQTPEIKKEPEMKQMPEFRQAPVLADHFVPNDVLENFIGRQYRAGAAEVLGPNNADTLSSPIRFRWKEMEGIHSFIVAVVDNKNEEVWRGSTESYELTCDLQFRSGLYYWMLKTDGDILSVRKFFVR